MPPRCRFQHSSLKQGRNSMKVHGLQHIGFTVPDMDEAVAFFESVFGNVTVLSTGLVDVDEEYMRRRLGVAGNCRIEDIKVLRVGNGSNSEIFRYSGDPDRAEILKRNSHHRRRGPGRPSCGTSVPTGRPLRDCWTAATTPPTASLADLRGRCRSWSREKSR